MRDQVLIKKNNYTAGKFYLFIKSIVKNTHYKLIYCLKIESIQIAAIETTIYIC